MFWRSDGIFLITAAEPVYAVVSTYTTLIPCFCIDMANNLFDVKQFHLFVSYTSRRFAACLFGFDCYCWRPIQGVTFLYYAGYSLDTERLFETLLKNLQLFWSEAQHAVWTIVPWYEFSVTVVVRLSAAQAARGGLLISTQSPGVHVGLRRTLLPWSVS